MEDPDTQGNTYRFLKAMGACNKGDFPTAFQLLTELAKLGDSAAQNALGNMYWRGLGTPRDKAKAEDLYRMAAEQGNADAQVNLGDMKHNKYRQSARLPLISFSDRDEAEAERWYRLAAEQGNASGQCGLGTLISDGALFNKSKAREAAHWFRLAAEQGNARAQTALAIAYSMGIGVDKDEAEAKRWYLRAADQGYAHAQTNIGEMYHWGTDHVQKDAQEALRWYHLAARQDYAQAQYRIGHIYAVGDSVPKNCTIAYMWYLISNANGCNTADFLEEIQDEMTYDEIVEAEKRAREHMSASDQQKDQGVRF